MALGIRGALGIAALGGLLGGKLYLYHKYRSLMNRGDVTRQPGFWNRRSFGALARRKQRAIIYAKRAQLRDFEGIAYSGYAPLGGRRRHRRLWGS